MVGDWELALEGAWCASVVVRFEGAITNAQHYIAIKLWPVLDSSRANEEKGKWTKALWHDDESRGRVHGQTQSLVLAAGRRKSIRRTGPN